MALHLEQLERDLQAPTSESICKALSTAWRELGAGNDVSSGQWAQVALDYSWEQLNTGHWEDASVEWRRVYATAALVKAVGLEKAGEPVRALEVLDRGIMLGAPILDLALHRLASSLTLSGASHRHTECASAGKGLSGTAGGQREGESHKRAKKIIFRNYKPISESTDHENSVQMKKPRVDIDVYDLVSRTANVPLINPQCRVPLKYLPPLDVFRESYMLTRTPIVISGALDTWPAYSARKWRWALIRVGLQLRVGMY